jgi:hypothetical protein
VASSSALRGAVLAAVAFAGCSSASDVPGSWSVLAAATLVPGRSLGELELGGTTLADVLARHGPGASSVVVADEYAFELSYGGGQLALLFLADGECRRRLMGYGVRDAADALAAGASFVASWPECAAVPLQSVYVALPEGAATGFYTGATERGVRLGAPLAAALATLGSPDGESVLLLAGQATRGALEAYAYSSGIVVYGGAAPAGSEAGHSVVRALALYAP